MEDGDGRRTAFGRLDDVVIGATVSWSKRQQTSLAQSTSRPVQILEETNYTGVKATSTWSGTRIEVYSPVVGWAATWTF